MTPVGTVVPRASLGFVLPASLQEELGSTTSTTVGGTTGSAVGDARPLANLCRRAEQSGADSLWAVDHLYWPHPVSEPLTALAVAATATTRPTLGTCVLQLPLRSPDAVAKQATALQLLSGGRFVLGLGVGSHEPEYRRAGADFRRRGRSLDAGVAVLRRAWGGARTADAGDDYTQTPASTPVPLWFGGASPAARRRAAAQGDGWIPLFLTADDYAEAVCALRRETVDAGRSADAVEPGVVVFARVGDDVEAARQGTSWLSRLYRLPPKAFDRHLVAGSPETCAGSLRRYVEAGARHIVVMVAGSPAVEHFARLRAAFVGQADRPLVGITP